MGRSTLSEHGFPPATVSTLLAAYDKVWAEVEPQVASGNIQVVQDAISSALIALAEVAQFSPERLRAYARDQARAALLPRLTER
jgi:hypothetical protein